MTTMKLAERLAAHSKVSTEIALLSDRCLLELLKTAQSLGTSIGGASSLLSIANTTVFVKKIPLTDLECRPENWMSTANVFNLPTYYQYGIGSKGFGVWRELATHTMTTNWVISNECPNFPIMYSWRLLPTPKMEPSAEEINELERDVHYWDNSPAVRTRLQESLNASTSIVLFMEYFPHNAGQWLAKELLKGDEAGETACTMVDAQLNTTVSFMKAHALLHFDAHLWNILTDGKQLYFSDFGLALSPRFELSTPELAFYKEHIDYDQHYIAAHYAKWLLIESFGEESWEAILHEYAKGHMQKTLPHAISKIIARYVPTTIIMTDFFEKLKTGAKTVPFPKNDLQRNSLKQQHYT